MWYKVGKNIGVLGRYKRAKADGVENFLRTDERYLFSDLRDSIDSRKINLFLNSLGMFKTS